jgi:gamma-glutamylcyclotransferase
MALARVISLAYGSNLHPFRLTQRVLSATPISVVSMPGMRLAFHKRSDDGSGKCLFYESRGAEDMMFSVAYEIDAAEKPMLDDLEGLGRGYNEQQVAFPLNGVTRQALMYVAASTHIDATLAPYNWYKEMVVLGAQYHRLPADYIAKIEAVVAVPDPNPNRAANRAVIVENMRVINAAQGV